MTLRSVFLTFVIGILYVCELAAESGSPAGLASIRWNELPDRLTGAMPAWWKLGLEIRGRAEAVTGLNGIADTSDAYYLHRLRLNSVITVRPWLKITSQMQDSRTVDYDRPPVPFNMRDPVDLRQAYADISIHGEQRWALRVGRQPLVFGDMRLVSTSNWSNVGPNYDGVRLTHNVSGVKLDFFSTLVVMPGEVFDRPRADRKLSGFYGTFDARKWHATVETYTFWKSNLRAVDEGFHAGHMDVYTTGIRKVGKLPAGFDYNVEMAMQRGHISGDGLRAWFGHWEAGKRLRGADSGPRVWLEHNFASGDEHTGDGRRQAFEQLYPTPWNVVGRAVDIASRNLHEPMVGIEWQATRRWKLRSTMRGFWLANGNDALYTLAGAVYARKPGAASTHVGEEAGGWAIYQVSNHLQLWVGYARLFSGSFLKEAGRGSCVNYPFAVWTYTL